MGAAPSPQEVRSVLALHLPEIRERFAVSQLSIFGSVARDAGSECSDLDVLVDMADPTFDRFMDLKFEIEDELGVLVDLVLADTLKARLRPIIEAEVVYA